MPRFYVARRARAGCLLSHDAGRPLCYEWRAGMTGTSKVDEPPPRERVGQLASGTLFIFACNAFEAYPSRRGIEEEDIITPRTLAAKLECFTCLT